MQAERKVTLVSQSVAGLWVGPGQKVTEEGGFLSQTKAMNGTRGGAREWRVMAEIYISHARR